MNGLKEGQHHSWTRRARPGEGGHSAVTFVVWWQGNFRWRKRVICQCGKKFTGWGDRSAYAYGQHFAEEVGYK